MRDVEYAAAEAFTTSVERAWVTISDSSITQTASRTCRPAHLGDALKSVTDQDVDQRVAVVPGDVTQIGLAT